MTKVVSPSAKPVTREQAGKFCDKLIPRLRKSGIKSGPLQMVLAHRERSDEMLNAVIAVVCEHTDKIGEIIRINRAARPVYPDWMEKLMHPELEATGPAEYNLGDIDQWLHEKQKTGVAGGNEIYEHLENNGTLESCLGLADLHAIQKLGIEVFRKHFAGKAVFGWRSVVLNRDGSLHVPCLIEDGDEVKLYWNRLVFDWCVVFPALRFRK